MGPRIPLQYERAVLAGAVVRKQLRTTTIATVWSRAYDLVAHQQATMPEPLLAPPAADSEHDDQEPEAAPDRAIDMKALRALRRPHTDVKALDLTADRLRHLQNAFVKVGENPASAWLATRAGRRHHCGPPVRPPAHPPRPRAPYG
ncbi:hypothetical protein [Streptomyces sp. CFMR 7]|uniref:hypothetical protein n=1 Tax=Streptomyces sp. CFMR 7 TaxID=1649184 RepID=UPI0006AD1A11|nr:hypothetical protein [Streptomyces sp. CFMR 7]